MDKSSPNINSASNDFVSGKNLATVSLTVIDLINPCHYIVCLIRPLMLFYKTSTVLFLLGRGQAIF